jgi:hypothetical protein
LVDAVSTPAIFGLLGVVVGGFITWFAQASLLSRRIVADEAIAEKKFAFDKDLAERRFRYDRDLHDQKRKVEFAELVLAQFMQVSDVISSVRSPVAFANESDGRPHSDGETETQRKQRDTYYVPLARLANHSEFINGLLSKRYQARVLLGEDAELAFKELHSVIVEIQVAASSIIRMIGHGGAGEIRNLSHQQACEEKIWEGLAEADPLKPRVLAAAKKIEDLCGPILERR